MLHTNCEAKEKEGSRVERLHDHLSIARDSNGNYLLLGLDDVEPFVDDFVEHFINTFDDDSST
jgi:hypothetical protein